MYITAAGIDTPVAVVFFPERIEYLSAPGPGITVTHVF
jgi:hypothetical protein